MLTYEEYIDWLKKSVTFSKNKLNPIQLKSKYNRYRRSEEKRKEAHERYVETALLKSNKELDKRWLEVREAAYKRDEYSCQLIKKRPYVLNEPWVRENYFGSLTILDPCHIFSRGSYPFLKYDIDNIVILSRLFHSMLDQYRSPVNGLSLTKEGVLDVWSFLIGQERYERLMDRIKEHERK